MEARHQMIHSCQYLFARDDADKFAVIFGNAQEIVIDQIIQDILQVCPWADGLYIPVHHIFHFECFHFVIADRIDFRDGFDDHRYGNQSFDAGLRIQNGNDGILHLGQHEKRMVQVIRTMYIGDIFAVDHQISAGIIVQQ